jgi:DNA invertase Pin-like site-specific DNA recombinase
MIVGYARVSTDGQSLEAQHASLAAAGAERVFAEKVSGAKTDRAALARCLRGLEAGDVLLVTKLDRPARSTRDLLNTLAAIGEAGASFKSLGDPWADTTSAHGRLMLTWYPNLLPPFITLVELGHYQPYHPRLSPTTTPFPSIRRPIAPLGLS